MKAVGVFVAGCLVLVVLQPATVGALAPAAYVSVAGVGMTPDTPRPDQPFTVTPPVVNHPGSPAPLELTSVVLRTDDPDGDRVLDRAQDLGVLAPGTSIDVPLSGSLSQPGTHSLRVEAYGWANGSLVHLRYPVIVRIDRRPSPLVTVEATKPVAGVETALNVTVASRDGSAIRGGLMTVRDRRSDETLSKALIGRVGGEETRRVQIPVRPMASGQRPLVVTLRYVTTDGFDRVVRVVKRLTVEPPRVQLRLVASDSTTADEGGVHVVVVNRGNVPAENLTLRVGGRDHGLESRALRSLSPGQRQAVTVPTPGGPPGRSNLTVSLRYRAIDRSYRSRTAVAVTRRPGRVVLTGVAVDREGDRVHIAGHASNVGLTPVRSLVVRPRRTTTIRPSQPTRSYFVGTVPASDFVPFEVTVRAAPNASVVPLVVSGLRDGESTERVHRVPLEARDVDPTEPTATPVDAPMMIAGATTVGVAGLMVVAWRNRRDGA